MADTFIQVNVVWEAPLKGDCQREAAPQALMECDNLGEIEFLFFPPTDIQPHIQSSAFHQVYVWCHPPTVGNIIPCVRFLHIRYP